MRCSYVYSFMAYEEVLSQHEASQQIAIEFDVKETKYQEINFSSYEFVDYIESSRFASIENYP